MPYIREDQADIRVTVNGVSYGDSWNEIEGGNLEADNAKARPGGMGGEVDVGGPATRGDLTVRIQMTDIVANWHPTFETAIRNGWRARVGVSFLSPDRTPNGSGLTRQGTVKAANLPDMGSGADVSMYELVIGMDELAA